LAGSGRKERKGKRRELGGFSGVRRRPAGQGRRRKEGGGKGADRWGPPVGAAAKKKRGRGEPWAGGERWVGPPGPKGVWAFCFFSFSFSNFIFKSFFKSNSNQTFANFSQIFYRLFRDHSSNKTMQAK
jgi:hypothetical protein